MGEGHECAGYWFCVLVEIGSDKPEEAKKFSSELFGWQFKINTDLEGVGYHAAITLGSPGLSGGIFDPAGHFEDYAIFYVLVEAIQATLEKAKTLGAEITMDPVVDASGVSFARLRDANCHHFGVYSMPGAMA